MKPHKQAYDATTIRYQLTNHLDSASIELDENADIISYEEYHPFGTTSYRNGRSAAEVSLKRYKYVFKELDNETGLYYYGMRYYAAWTARFVSVDPLQHKFPFYTPFQYSGNNPATFFDLDGNETTDNNLTNVGTNGQQAVLESAVSPENNTPTLSWAVTSEDTFKWTINTPKLPNYSSSNTWTVGDTTYSQVTSNTLVMSIFGSNKPPEYKFILPRDFGEFSQPGSDGLIWTGCMSCHASNGAYRYAAYNSRERIVGNTIASFILMFSDPLISGFPKNIKPKFVYRGDSRGPSQIMKEGGFLARGNFDDLIANTEKAKVNSAFISTSEEIETATMFSIPEYNDFGYVYKIRNTKAGINVNKYFKNKGLTSPYPWQKEFAFKYKIDASNIEGVYFSNEGRIISNYMKLDCSQLKYKF